MVIPRPFLSEKMAARRIQLVFGKFVRILPELFTRIVKGTTETVIVDAAEQEIRNCADFRPSNHQDEKSSQEEATLTSSSHSEYQPKFKNDQ